MHNDQNLKWVCPHCGAVTNTTVFVMKGSVRYDIPKSSGDEMRPESWSDDKTAGLTVSLCPMCNRDMNVSGNVWFQDTVGRMVNIPLTLPVEREWGKHIDVITELEDAGFQFMSESSYGENEDEVSILTFLKYFPYVNGDKGIRVHMYATPGYVGSKTGIFVMGDGVASPSSERSRVK